MDLLGVYHTHTLCFKLCSVAVSITGLAATKWPKVGVACQALITEVGAGWLVKVMGEGEAEGGRGR